MKSPSNILHIVPALFGPDGVVGGAERYAFELARYMAEQAPTRLLTFGERTRQERVGNLEIQVLGNPYYVRGQRHNPIAGRSFAQALRWANIVHCHQRSIVASSAAAAFCRATGRRVFVSDLGGGGWDISAYISTERWFQGHLHISEYSRRISQHDGKSWGHVIYGGVDIDKFSPSSPKVLPRRSVVFVGRMLPHKGVDDLIRAVSLDTPVELIGKPYDERYYQDLQKLARGKDITFRNGCDDDTLIEAYRNALCVVLPSVYRTMYGDETKVPELLGQTLLEGMACGVPAICTNVASMPEVVEDGVTGFVVPPNSPDALKIAIKTLQSHPERTHEMGQNARARVLRLFTWPVVVKKCLEIYRHTN